MSALLLLFALACHRNEPEAPGVPAPVEGPVVAPGTTLDPVAALGLQIRANGGWDASLAQMIALWVRRRPKGLFAQRVLQRLALPLHNWLLKRDEAPVGFSSSTPSTMITGLSATAFKPQHAPAS